MSSNKVKVLGVLLSVSNFFLQRGRKKKLNAIVADSGFQ